MKNPLILLTLLVSLILPSCGPNEADLRAELQAIDSEMVMLRNAAYRHQSEMSQAEFAALMGTLTTTYGITSGEGNVTGQGIGTVVGAASDYDVANYSLEQIKERQIELIRRRTSIQLKLK